MGFLKHLILKVQSMSHPLQMVVQKSAFTRHKHQVRYLIIEDAIHKPTIDYCKSHIKILI
jgi:hypothetical protein